MKFKSRTLCVLICIFSLSYIISGCSSTKETPSKDISSDFVYSEPVKEPVKKEIEITLDNWDTYFEFVEKEEVSKNDYNEVDHIRFYYSLDLKDQYTLDKVDINVDFSYIYTVYDIQEDLTNKKIIWGNVIEGPAEETKEIKMRYDEYSVAGETVFVSNISKTKCTDFKVNRIYGTLVIIE